MRSQEPVRSEQEERLQCKKEEEKPVRREKSLCSQESVRGEEPVRRERKIASIGATIPVRGPSADSLSRPVSSAAHGPIDIARLPRTQLEAMHAAGLDILECYRVLRKGGLNVVGEVLRGHGKFFEMEHYPTNDVFDAESHAQYYYHAHRVGEHGHFHTFLRNAGMPPGIEPMDLVHDEPWPDGDDRLAHLIAISMDDYGYPTGLFAPNRWVVDDAWYGSGDLIRMIDAFRIDHAYPSWPVNRWIGAMFVLFRPHIESLLLERDRAFDAWRRALPGEDVLERREIEIYASMPIAVDDTFAAVRAALAN